MRLRFSLLSLVLLATAAQAQTPLTPGQSVDRDLGSADAHAYTLDLAADQFVLGEAVQHTVDVVVQLAGPDGRTLQEFDSPARGPEPFQFVSDEAGTYTLTVTPFEEAEGRYTMMLRRVEPTATTPEGIVAQQYAVLDRDDSPGAVVAIARRGELVFGEAYGMADLTHGVPYTLDTPTNIGSTSKQFTAFAIGLLAERGELSLDDDIRQHIPELPDLGATVTIRHLLTHTSGYREFLNAVVMSGRSAQTIARDEIIAIVQRQPELQNEPGAEWNYNNTAFALLATVVERTTGEGFPEWMRANVFEPLGMAHTYVREDPTVIIPGRASGYVAGEDGGWREVVDLGGAMGAGSIYSTAPDLAKWMDNYRTAALGGEALIREMTTPYVLTTGDTTGYGLGLFIDELRGLRRFQHGGADAAHRSTFGYLPEIESGLIVLTNFPNAPDALGVISEAFFGEHFAPEPEAEEAPAAADFDPETFDPETFDAYAGRYELEEAPGFILTFRRDGDQYFTQATGQSEVPIYPIAENRFELRVVDAEVTFHMEDDGSVARITLHQNGDQPGNRVAEEGEAPDLADYTGRYFSDELEAFYTVALVDGELHLSHRTTEEPISLTHNTGEGFTGGYPIAEVEFVRDESGAVIAFLAGSGRTRGVRFERVGE
ncbi:MAG TPA: serine hydrolase [Bacteroidetes bacterium]|nr:serine hydrolase [Bacteroidota bacterium]